MYMYYTLTWKTDYRYRVLCVFASVPVCLSVNTITEERLDLGS